VAFHFTGVEVSITPRHLHFDRPGIIPIHQTQIIGETVETSRDRRGKAEQFASNDERAIHRFSDCANEDEPIGGGHAAKIFHNTLPRPGTVAVGARDNREIFPRLRTLDDEIVLIADNQIDAGIVPWNLGVDPEFDRFADKQCSGIRSEGRHLLIESGNRCLSSGGALRLF
jgi:hypothetical protein